MSDEALNLRRSTRILRRHIAIVGVAAALGLLAGVAFALLKPPMRTSSALVLLPPAVAGGGAQPTRYLATQLVVAVSSPVLAGAADQLHPAVPVQTMRHRVTVSSPSADLIAFTAQDPTTAQAEDLANAMANSYIAHIRTPGNPDVLLLQRAVSAVGTSPATRLVVDAGLGAVLGALAGSVLLLATRRDDRRLQQRDEIADATGVPVLASIPVPHPANPAGWAKLLDDYQPDAVQAWSLRKILHRLGLADGREGDGARLAMVSLASDHRALALGPQLASFAASQGIPTTLVVSQDQDAQAMAALRAACASRAAPHPGRPGELRVLVGAAERAGQQLGTPLTVIVDVVSAQAPRPADPARATATVLGVSAGAATAEDLARVAVSAAGGGRIAGILLADADPADETTGCLPQPARPRPLTRPSAR